MALVTATLLRAYRSAVTLIYPDDRLRADALLTMQYRKSTEQPVLRGLWEAAHAYLPSVQP